jgi:predicted transcriptional regulator/transcriptional regulator with XRE-family HTH domain
MDIDPTATLDDEEVLDSLTIGRRIRQLRSDRGMTLDDLATLLERAPSQVSVIENGKRELKIGELQRLSRLLGITLDELLSPVPPSRRAALEIALERAQRGPLYASLPLPALPIRKTLSDEAIETILGLHDELQRLHTERAATPEEARRANVELRAEQRKRGNHFADLEATARDLLESVGHSGGPLSQRVASDLASHLGFTLHYVADLPSTTRSVTDQRNGRIYLPVRQTAGGDPRSALLQALAAHVLGKQEPRDYADLLRQRVETNYLAGALLIPEASAVEFLQAAKAARELSVEDLRDAFATTYETAAHRFTNLATHHLGIPVHFMRVHSSGTVYKAYENDHVRFPADVTGAIEGQLVCRRWASRTAFEAPDKYSAFYQHTDTATGRYWCTVHVEATRSGEFSVTVGTPYEHARWFRGGDTANRTTSSCPDPGCCQLPPADLVDRWAGQAWPSARVHSHLLAALPPGTFPGVDTTDVYAFLQRRAEG